VAYTFDNLFAADPSNPTNVAANASILLYDPADPTKAPVTITDPTGSPIPNPVTVNKNGFGPAMQHTTLDRLAWEGGGFSNFITSYEGIKNEAVSARTAAEEAAATAGADAAAVADAAIGTATDEAAAAAAAATAAADAADASALAAANSAALVGAPADNAIATAINAPASATKTALSATYGLGNVDGAQTAVLFGDSIIAQCEDDTISTTQGFYSQYSWTNWANMFLGYRIRVVKNSGIGGNTTTQMLARIDTDVKPYDSDWVIMDGGVNDLFSGTGITLATTISNLTNIFEKITKNYGRKVMMMLPTGSGYGTATTFTELYKLHRWLKTYAREHRGIYLFDGHGWFCDPADGMPIVSYVRPGDATAENNNRGVHPGYLGAAKIGRALADAIEPHLDKASGLTTSTNADTLNLISNGRMTGNVSGLATGWTLQGAVGGAATGVTATKVARSDGKPGEAQQIIATDANGCRLFNQNTDTTKFAAGDLLYAEVEFETDPDTAGNYGLGLQLDFWNALGSTSSIKKSSNDGTLPAVDVYPRAGVIRTPVKAIPATTGRLQLFINLPKGTSRILSVNVRKVDY